MQFAHVAKIIVAVNIIRFESSLDFSVIFSSLKKLQNGLLQYVGTSGGVG
jgi:hypothetical protein